MFLEVSTGPDHTGLSPYFGDLSVRESQNDLFALFQVLAAVDSSTAGYGPFNGTSLIFQIVPDDPVGSRVFLAEFQHLFDPGREAVPFFFSGALQTDRNRFEHAALSGLLHPSITVIRRKLMPTDIQRREIVPDIVTQFS